MITVGILRCDVCGAPMYPNPAKQAFCCPFCGNVSAYGMQQSRMKHEHRKLEFTEEGYFSLKRVAILTPVSVKEELLAKRKWRTFDESKPKKSFPLPVRSAERTSTETLS